MKYEWCHIPKSAAPLVPQTATDIPHGDFQIFHIRSAQACQAARWYLTFFCCLFFFYLSRNLLSHPVWLYALLFLLPAYLLSDFDLANYLFAELPVLILNLMFLYQTVVLLVQQKTDFPPQLDKSDGWQPVPTEFPSPSVDSFGKAVSEQLLPVLHIRH